MQPREKKLAIAVGCLVVVMGVYWIYQKIGEAFDARYLQIASLDKSISDKQFEVLKGQRAAARRARWQEQSLPANLEQAKFLYQSWLRNLVDQAKLDDVNVSTSIARSRRGLYDRLTFSVTGRGDLAQLTRLLYDFYRADHLHQIRSLSVKPIEKSKQLDLSLSIEALALPGADRTNELNPAVSDRPKLADFDSYREAIVGRNLFAAYVPPPPARPPVVRRDPPKPQPPRPRPPSFDVAKYAFVTAILQERTGPRVWLNVRTTGETLKLAVGEEFSVGDLKATVAQVTERAVVFATDKGRLLVGIGENLREGARLPDEGI
jgi:hypothetical protein